MRKTKGIIRRITACLMAGAVFAATFTGGTVGNAVQEVKAEDIPADVAQFPRSYQAALYALKTAHPSWTFQLYDTGLEWDTVMYNETNPASRSLLPSYFDSSFFITSAIA